MESWAEHDCDDDIEVINRTDGVRWCLCVIFTVKHWVYKGGWFLRTKFLDSLLEADQKYIF